MAKNYPILKKIIFLFFWLFTISAFSQTAGDFRSKITGSWTATSSWQTYNGTTWVDATSYPGQNAGTGAVLIQFGHTITLSSAITTQNFGDFTIAGRLVLNGDNSSGGMNFSLNTPKIYVTPSPNGGFIEFNSKLNLRLPATASFIVSDGGLDVLSGCSANQIIYIGNIAYSKCNGGGSQLPDFTDVMQGGGTLSANPTSNSPVCIGNSINLIGNYTGVVGKTTSDGNTNGVNYSWVITDPNNNTSSSPNKDISFSASLIGNYTATLTCTTYFGVTLFTNIKSISVTVNSLPSTPIVGAITQPTCSLATGSAALSGLPATGTWTLTRNPGAVTTTGTGTTTTINGLSAGTYNYTVTNAAGCTSTASANVVVNAQPVINTWIGNGAIANWNDPANWCVGVPNISNVNTLNVVIPSGFYPTINSSDVAEVVNMVVENGAILNIVDNYLKVTGILTLNGKIDLNGESQLVQDTGSNLIGTGTIEIDQQGEGNRYRYNYWSMPVYTANDGTNYTTIFNSLRDGRIPGSPALINFSNSGYDGALTTPITLSTYWMYKYANSGSGYSAWSQVRSTGRVYSGQGFTMKGPGAPGSPAQNYVFVGTPNNGNINLTVAANYDYLVGNPYPSAIDADQFILDNANSITGAIYFWEHYGGDTHNLAGYQGGYATYSLGGEAPAAAFPGLGGGSSVKGAPKQFIPVGQAFFVVGDAIDGGQIQFNNGQRDFKRESLGEAVFLKSSNNKAKTDVTNLSDLRPKFRIGFDAPKISHRQLLLTIDERATPAADWGFDAEIYEIFADDMYWMLNNKKYVIQAFNKSGLNSEVPLGIQLSKTGMVTVKIDALENVHDNTAIYLKDKLTGETFNMMKKPVQLNLTAGKYADRFVLIFKTQKLMAEDVAEILIPASAKPIIEGIHVFMNKALGELQIKNHSTDEIESVTLINATGQKVKTWNSNFNARTISLPISSPTGVYIVQISTKNGKTIKKISVE